jgi:hypothetical protein
VNAGPSTGCAGNARKRASIILPENLAAQGENLTLDGPLIIIKVQGLSPEPPMYLWNKILVALIGVAALPLLFLAMWTLKTEKTWGESAKQHELALERVQNQIEELTEGVEKDGVLVKPGIRQMSLAWYKLLLDRRRAWAHCDPKIKIGRQEGTAEITLTIEQPTPHGIIPKDAPKDRKAVVYAFEETDVQKKGQYLGEFTATNQDDKHVVLVPTATLNPRELDRLEKLAKAKTRGPWVIYEMLPRDNHELLAGLSDQELKAMLPADTLAEYLKDGKPAAADDPKERVQAGKYVRQLRDYGVLFGAEQRKRVLLSASLEASRQDKQLIDEALADARKQEEACKRDIRTVTQSKALTEHQRDVVTAYCKQLEEKLAAVQEMTARLIKTNQAMAGQMAQLQLEAAARIDARTRAMAQSAAERR